MRIIQQSIFILVLTGSACFTPEKQSEECLQPESPVSAVQLYQMFETEGEVARMRYEDKTVFVCGKVDHVVTGAIAGKVVLSAGEVRGGIVCEIKNAQHDQVISLKKGQEICCKGKFAGFLLDVSLIQCSIIKQ